MHITPITQNNSTNFKAINFVQLPKKAFINPENRTLCTKIFQKHIDKATKDPLKGFWGSIIAFLGGRHFAKTGILSDNPSFIYTITGMEHEKIPYSLSWVKRNTDLPIKDSWNVDDNLKFLVFTKEDKDAFVGVFSNPLKNLFKYMKEGLNRYKTFPGMAGIYANAKVGVETDALLEKLIGNREIKTIEIETLDDIFKIINKLDI